MSLPRRLLRGWLAVEIAAGIAAGIAAMVEIVAVFPVVAYLSLHTLALAPAWAGLVVAPNAARLPLRVWRGAVSPVVAAIILVAVTLVVAVALYVLLALLSK